MAKTISSLDSLKNESIRIYPGITIVQLRTMQEEQLDMSEQVTKFDGCYAINNTTICFVTDNEAFVTPYTKQVIKLLQAEGFTRRNFYVPLSNCEYPKNEHEKWNVLRNNARNEIEQEFTEACIYYCNENGIRSLSDETLKRCMKIPTMGVEVEKEGKTTKYYPIISSTTVDYTVANDIGKYCFNNGVVVFTYQDGKTYVTKGDRIIEELKKAGYKETMLFVPFSQGEEIKSLFIKKLWDLIHE